MAVRRIAAHSQRLTSARPIFRSFTTSTSIPAHTRHTRIQEDQWISGRNNILQEAATDAARAKLRRFANRAFRSGLFSRAMEMAAEPGPRHWRELNDRDLIPVTGIIGVSSNLIALRCPHRGHFPQRGLPSVSERHRYAYGPGKRYDHTLWRSNPREGTHLSP
jgi:hypothetical protein